MDDIIEDSPIIMGGVVYLGLELVDKGIEIYKLKIELLSSRLWIVEGTKNR